MRIERAEALGYEADLRSSENTIRLLLKKEDGTISKYDIGANLKVNKDPNGNLEVGVKKSKKNFGTTTMSYSRDTLFLSSELEFKDIAKKFFQDNPDEKEIMLVKTLAKYFVANSTDKLSVNLGKVVGKEGEKKKLREDEKKNNLQVYETPSNMYEIFFSMMQKELVETIALKESVKIKEILFSNEEIRKSPFLKDKSKNSIALSVIIDDIIKAQLNEGEKQKILGSSRNADLYQINQLVETHAGEILENIRRSKDSFFPFSNYATDEKLRLAIFDMQAGSGAGLFKGAENASIEVNLIGTEIRDLQDIDNGESLRDNKNYNVITGINSGMHTSDYVSLFSNGNLREAVRNTFVYQNPPYTQSNILAKDSLEVLSHGQSIFGLYPSSMKDFLQKNINGHVFQVPKKLTGYEDPSVPEHLLFVVGSRHDEEYVENEIQRRKDRGLFQHNSDFKTDAKSKYNIISTSDKEQASREMLKEIRISSNIYNFKLAAKNVYSYQSAKKGESPLFEPMKRYIENSKEVFDNLKEIKEKIESKKIELISTLGSDDALRTEKIFPDYRNYSADGIVNKCTFTDVISQRNLMIFYRDNYPEIYKVVEKIADEDNIKLGLTKSLHGNYSLSNPQKPEKKDVVSTKTLGLMRRAYDASSYSLSSIEDKDALLKVIEDIGEGEYDASIGDLLVEMVKEAKKLIVKNEDVLEDDIIVKKEVLVLVDGNGADLGKLNVSLTDFHKSIEKLGMFNIDDYVEHAILKDDKKKKILNNFLKYVENTIARFNEFSPKEEDIVEQSKRFLIKIKEIQTRESEDKNRDQQITREYVEFAKENNLFEYFGQFLKKGDVFKMVEDAVKDKLEVFEVDNDKGKDFINDIVKMFKDKPVLFFEDERALVEKFIKEKFTDLTAGSSFSKEAKAESLQNMTIDIFEELSEEHEKQKAISEGAVKSAKLIVLNYNIIKILQKKGIEDYKLYDSYFKNIMTNTFGLMDHQFSSPEGFVEMSDHTKSNMYSWEPRSGKSLAVIAEEFLLSLYKEEEASLYMETKNINDITMQCMRHFPIIIPNIRFNMPKSNLTKSVLNKEVIYEYLGEDSELFINIPKILNPYFIERGEGQSKAKERFSFEFEELLEKVKEADLSLEEMRNKHKDSIFYPLLSKACDGK